MLSTHWLLPKSWKKPWGFLAGTFFLAVIYFLAYDRAHQSFLLQDAAKSRESRVTGTIASPVKRDGDLVRFALTIPREQTDESIWGWFQSPEKIAMRVSLTEEAQIKVIEQWQYGDSFSGTVTLALPETARNPHAFDYSRYLRWQGIYVTGEAPFASIQVKSSGGSWRSLFIKAQTTAANRLEELYTTPETRGYMKSLLLGMQAEVSPELQNIYANLGILHVLAISGLHVTVVSMAFLWAAEKAGLSRRKAVLIALLLIGAYVLWVGASASALRAGIMGGIGLWSQMRKERIHARAIWAIALILMLLYDPFQLWQIGFQLSFVVTLGLIELVPLFMIFPYPKPAWVRSLCAVTVSSQLVSFPFVVYWFHLFNPLSAPVNLLAVPVLSLIVLPLGYATLQLGSLHPALAMLAVRMNEYLLQWIHKAFSWLDQWQPPMRHWPHPEWWWLFCYGIVLILFSCLWKKGYHRFRDLAVYMICLALLLIMARQPYAAADEVRITFLDVGQGDSVVVEIGKKTVYLIDGGGTLRFSGQEAWRKRRDPFEAGKDTLLPYLRARGIEHIDRLIMTHWDADHVGAIPAILPYFSFGAALVNRDVPEGVAQQILDDLRQRQVPVLTGRPGDRWEDQPGVQWTWLHPDADDGFSGNDASVVLQLTAYGKKILFTGDLEQDGENKLLRDVRSTIDVLKVGHHGSKTSTSLAFLQQLEPQIAVISAGRQNRYGHPHEEVLQRLADEQVQIYRTDQHGAITLHIRPDKMIRKTQILAR